MGYYVKDKDAVYGFASRKDALMFIRKKLRYEHSREYIFSDRSCKKVYANVQYMGWGSYNYYTGSKSEWEKGRWYTVDADGSVVDLRKKKR